MNDGEEQHSDHIHNINRTRTKWTSGMCNDILTSREKAKAFHSLAYSPPQSRSFVHLLLLLPESRMSERLKMIII